MPAVAVIGGAIGMASGAAAITAAGGLAAMSAGAALSAGAMVVGGAMTVAGAVTGNKTLSKFGGVLGLAGGIGGLATGTLGDPSKVFSGGGTLDTGGSWFGGSASSGAANSLGGSMDLASKSGMADSTINLGNSNLMTNGASRAGSSVGDSLSVNSGSFFPATNAVTKAASASTSIFDKLAKYDKLTNIAGGIADYYQKQQTANQDQMQFDRIMALKTAQLNSGANVNVGISPPANYQPVQPISQAIPMTPYKTTGLIAAGA